MCTFWPSIAHSGNRSPASLVAVRAHAIPFRKQTARAAATARRPATARRSRCPRPASVRQTSCRAASARCQVESSPIINWLGAIRRREGLTALIRDATLSKLGLTDQGDQSGVTLRVALTPLTLADHLALSLTSSTKLGDQASLFVFRQTSRRSGASSCETDRCCLLNHRRTR
jgi:hypothetical protein